jgi:hypothetical protein
LCFGDLVGTALAEVGELPDGPQVAMDRALAHPGKLQVVLHGSV